MGRNRVGLLIDSDILRAIISDKTTWSEIARKYGVSRQAVNGWLDRGVIPPRALFEIVRELNVNADVLKEILAPQTKKNTKRTFKVIISCEEITPSDTERGEK